MSLHFNFKNWYFILSILIQSWSLREEFKCVCIVSYRIVLYIWRIAVRAFVPEKTALGHFVVMGSGTIVSITIWVLYAEAEAEAGTRTWSWRWSWSWKLDVNSNSMVSLSIAASFVFCREICRLGLKGWRWHDDKLCSTTIRFRRSNRWMNFIFLLLHYIHIFLFLKYNIFLYLWNEMIYCKKKTCFTSLIFNTYISSQRKEWVNLIVTRNNFLINPKYVLYSFCII